MNSPIDNIYCYEHDGCLLEKYCKDCNVLICLKCSGKSVHSEHGLCDFEIEYQRIKSGSDELVEELNSKRDKLNKNKEIEVDLFEVKVKSSYEKEKQQLSESFRDLHDSLHIKEVELKRELQSYFEDNQENYLKIISEYDYQINQLSNSISNLTSISKNDSNNTNNEKIKFLNSYLNNNKTITSNNNNNNENENDKKSLILYRIGKIENQIQKAQDAIAYMQLTVGNLKSSIHLNSSYIKQKYFYYRIDEGFQTIDINSGDTITLIKANADDSPVKQSENYFFFQDNSESGYLFNDKQYWVIKEIDGLYSFINRHSDTLKSYEQSTIYDSTSNRIFIVGGWNGTTSTDQITIFNTLDESFVDLCKLPVPLRACSLSFDEKSNDLYIYGGYSSIGTNISVKERRVFKINLETKESITITEDAFGLTYKNIVDYHFSGCYVPKNQSHYVAVDGMIYQIPKDNDPIQVGTIEIKDLYSFIKFLYDGNNTITIVNRYSTDTYELDITTNQFFKTPFKFKKSLDIDDYISMY